MKKALGLLLILPFLSFVNTKPLNGFEPVVVIELFTSEGCSSCPPADELLIKTMLEANRDGKKIYALAFHVDYWNRLGWKDTFSTRQYTERQQSYVKAMNLQGAYTPQMVVNGKKEFVGSDKSALRNALDDALATKAVATFSSFKITRNDGIGIAIHYELQGDFKNCDIHFALVSLHETTSVKRGENGGRTLNHSNVVRQLVTANAEASGDIKFEASPLPDKNNLSVIAFVQHRNDGQIIAAAEVK